MREIEANIWDLYPTHWVVIPTNIGYKSNGENVMGAGLAKDVKDRWPELPKWYGEWCMSMKEDTPALAEDLHRLIFFPTKTLDPKRPYLSWKQDSSIELITRSAEQLSAMKIDSDIAVPMVGCGHGGLSPDLVVPVLKAILSDDRFVLVRPREPPLIF